MRIRAGFEPALHPALQGLPRLGIVIIHKGNRLGRSAAHQRILKELAQVVLAISPGYLMEMLVQGHIEEAHGIVDRVQVTGERRCVVVPIFAHGEHFPPRVRPDGWQPIPVKGCGDMLHCVQAKPVTSGGVRVPGAPQAQFRAHQRIVHVHVRTHEVIEVAFFPVHIPGPVLAFHAVQPLGMGQLIPVHTGKAPVIPLECRILSFPAREGKPGEHPGGDQRRILQGAVFRVILMNVDLFPVICAQAVVEHHIGQHLNIRPAQGAYGRQVSPARTVFGAHRTLLVKLSQVVQVVDAIAHVLDSRCALVGRRQPQGGKTHSPQPAGLTAGMLPPTPVLRQFPLEILQHYAVHAIPPLSRYYTQSRTKWQTVSKKEKQSNRKACLATGQSIPERKMFFDGGGKTKPPSQTFLWRELGRRGLLLIYLACSAFKMLLKPLSMTVRFPRVTPHSVGTASQASRRP